MDSTPAVPFTADKIARANAVAPDWFKAAITLGAACGLRQGEATGLTVDLINLLAEP